MKHFNKWLACAALIGTALSPNVFSQTHYDDFLEKSETQNFTQNVITVTASDSNSVHSYFDKPATPINIDTDTLLSSSDFVLELPGLNDLFAVKEKTIINQIGGQNWIGDVVFLDPYGFETAIHGRAYFVESDGEVTGVINTKDEVIQIYPDGAGGQLFVRSNAEEFDNEGEILPGNDSQEPQAAPPVGGIRDGISPATLAAPYTIDIMFVVTDRVAEITDERANIETMITIGNDVLENSLIPARLRSVETYYTDYVEDGNLTTDLGRLRDPADGYMDEIHARRAEVGADMVMIVSDSNNYCGVAYLDAAVDWAFSAAFTGCMTTYTPIHELGHNFGAQHDIENGTNFYYSFGYGIYNNTQEPFWRTVMSYQCPGGGCGRVPYFTSPLLTHNALPLGDEDTADNARVLKIRVGEVAGYLPSITPYCNEYTATNDEHVNANRAFTETETVCTLEFFGNCYQSRTDTNYFAVGSSDALGTNNGDSVSTLHEDPAGYFSLTNNCDGSAGEISFAPEIQNIQMEQQAASILFSGEVFDANNDEVVSVEVKASSVETWATATLTEGNFEVEAPNTEYGEVNFDFRTTDSTGDSFTFSLAFNHELGLPPTIEADDPAQVFDNTVLISGRYTDPDSDVTEIRYQIDGEGNPETGEWLPIPIQSRYWSLEINNVPLGAHIIHLAGVDESNQFSNVITLEVEIVPGIAPECTFADAIPSTSGLAGEVELTGLVSDENGSDVVLEYRLNNGDWNILESYDRLTYRPVFTRAIEGFIAPNNSITTIDVRAIDSTNLITDCGTATYIAEYPNGDEAPSCEFVEIEKYEGNLRYFFSTSDPNGNQSQMFAKEASQEEWMQTWPNTIAGGIIPIPGIGEFTIQGRVVDTTSLEGLCETQFTVIDEGYTPIIDSAYGYFETQFNSVVISARATDYDGDVVLVETRETGSTEWQVLEKIDDYNNYQILLGELPNNIYSYEVRATDSGGRVSATELIDFQIDREVAPSLHNISYSLDLRSLTVSGEAEDQNGDLANIYIQLDDRSAVRLNGTEVWSTVLLDVENGSHTAVIYAEDARGNQSEQVILEFELDPGTAPNLEGVQISTNETNATITVTASDADDDLQSAYVAVDSGSYVRYTEQSPPGVFSINLSNLSAGNHNVYVYVLDLYGNQSVVETSSFTIEQTQACYENANTEHVDLGRATATTVCQFEFLGNCYNPSTTYSAVGSGDNLGSGANEITALLESSPGYFELITECPTVDTTPPVITVLGNNPQEISIGEAFIDSGASATDNVDGSVPVTATGVEEVDTSNEGTYLITYNAVDAAGNQAIPQTRTVIVTPDTVAPVITLLGDNPMNLLVGSEYIEENATAIDNVDGDLSASIVITGEVNIFIEGQYVLTYSVSDAAGNPASATRTVNVVGDVVAPTITLIGGATMTVDINSEFIDPGATALDDVDGDITSRIVVTGSVDTSIAGSYLLRYNVIDTAGNPANEAIRTVEVIDGPACFETTLSEHVIAGRVYEQYYSYYSTGTGTYLGSTFNDANTVMAIEESAPGNWNQVSSCN
ncbi:MAG: DUF5011 domain-containing protein [Agarilytica sp.]